MRITFDNLSQVNIENSKPERIASAGRTTKAATSYQVAFDGKDRVGFGIDANAGRNKNIVQLPLESAETDVQNMRNQLAVMSHTSSDLILSKMVTASSGAAFPLRTSRTPEPVSFCSSRA